MQRQRSVSEFVQISGVLKQIAARFPKSILFQKCVATTPIKFCNGTQNGFGREIR